MAIRESFVLTKEQVDKWLNEIYHNNLGRSHSKEEYQLAVKAFIAGAQSTNLEKYKQFSNLPIPEKVIDVITSMPIPTTVLDEAIDKFENYDTYLERKDVIEIFDVASKIINALQEFNSKKDLK